MVSCCVFFGWDNPISWRIWGCVMLGLVAGELIGLFTEYCTSFVHKPTKSIAKKSRVGEAGVIIQGLAIGMLSTGPPVFRIHRILLLTLFVCSLFFSISSYTSLYKRFKEKQLQYT